MMLELYGHRVEVAHDGQDGIALAQRFHPDVVLCDIGLPGMSGYEVAQRLRKEPRQPRWLVAITGYGNADDLRRSAQAGFDEHFVKPVDPTRLSQQLEKLASS
jgi:CheY-like chemotaxis protein